MCVNPPSWAGLLVELETQTCRRGAATQCAKETAVSESKARAHVRRIPRGTMKLPT